MRRFLAGRVPRSGLVRLLPDERRWRIADLGTVRQVLPESNRQVSGTVNVQRSARLPGLVAGQLDVVEPLQEIAQGDFRFHPGKRRAQAEVDSLAESEVRIGLAGNVEFFATLELIFISIGRSD